MIDYLIRPFKQDEADQAIAIEHNCFAPGEARTAESIQAQIEVAQDLFIVAVDKKTEKLIGFINAIATNEETFDDAFFDDASRHVANGKNIMFTGLAVLPEYRKQGIARQLIEYFMKREAKKKRRMAVLTCLTDKIAMYQKFKFVDCGLSKSTFGGCIYHEMRYYFEEMKVI